MTNNENEGYNGWANYETWVTALWIDNDQGSYYHRRELTCQVQESYPDDEDKQAYKLGDLLKDWIEELNPLTDQSSLFADLIKGALSAVNWREIATNFLSE
ncbi:MAG: hypothetical protein AB4063_07655 [Crocosphaera sp.]